MFGNFRRRATFAASAILVPGALAAVLSGGVAQASTPAATSGALGAYVGTQQDGNSLYVDVDKQSASSGTPVIAYGEKAKALSADPATDLAWLVPAGNYPTGSKEAVYDPSGRDTGQCLTEEGTKHWLVLEPCHGLQTQVWTFDSTTNGWVNAADGGTLTDNGNTRQLTDSKAATTPTGAKAQSWTFVQ